MSTGDRRAGLQRLADSLRARQEESEEWRSWTPCAVLQDYGDQPVDPIWQEVIRVPHRLGPGEARALAVRSWPADLWALVDDDMTLLPATSYRRAAERAGQPGVGLVSTLSVRGRQWGPGRLVDAFTCSPIVYVSGGLIVSGRIARLIVASLPTAGPPALFDDVEWALTAYLAGLRNYRYRGSIARHEVCSAGGRRAWVEASAGHYRLPDPLAIRVEAVSRPGYLGDRWQIPSSADLTPWARGRHRQARASSGGQ